MPFAQLLRALGPVDARRIWRDELFMWLVAVPLAMTAALRYAVPELASWLSQSHRFDLTHYYPLFTGYFLVTMMPLVFGFVFGFMLLDERDDTTLQALAVTPLPPRAYLGYRAMLPAVASVCFTTILVPLSGISSVSLWASACLGIASAPLASLITFLLPGIARNKVQGFALAKFITVLFMIPLLSYFITSPWHLIFGIIPSFWPIDALFTLTQGLPTLVSNDHLSGLLDRGNAGNGCTF